ncbi:MAG: hypothetical protein ACE5GT_08185 [Rhodospirillales bacterium]
MVRLMFVAATVALLVAGGAPETDRARAADAFVSAIDDLPVMPGLVEDLDAAMVFDSPAGRIVEAFAQGNVRAPDVLAFYAETLPQLGWRPSGTGVFRREQEILTVEFPDGERDGTPLTVRFALAPVPE